MSERVVKGKARALGDRGTRESARGTRGDRASPRDTRDQSGYSDQS